MLLSRIGLPTPRRAFQSGEIRHNPEGIDPNPTPTTCSNGSENRLPQGIRKAGVRRRRPLRILSPVQARTCGFAVSPLALGLLLSRDLHVPIQRSRHSHFRPRHSVVSDSRAAWVNGCCEPSIAHNPCATSCQFHPFSGGGGWAAAQARLPEGGVAVDECPHRRAMALRRAYVQRRSQYIVQAPRTDVAQ